MEERRASMCNLLTSLSYLASSLYMQHIEWRSVVHACAIFSHLSHLLSLLSVYLPFSLLCVLFSLLPLGASLARFARELSETRLASVVRAFRTSDRLVSRPSFGILAAS